MEVNIEDKSRNGLSQNIGEKEINLSTNPEFIEWKWVMHEDLPNVIVDFKKNMYLKLLDNIKKFIN